MSATTEQSPAWIPVNEKVRRRTVLVGDKMMQMFVEFQKGGYTPPHAHVHDQVVHVVRGKMKFTVAGVEKTIEQGQSCYFPGNAPHDATALEDSLLLDTFTPIRDDLIAMDRQGSRT